MAALYREIRHRSSTVLKLEDTLLATRLFNMRRVICCVYTPLLTMTYHLT